MKIKRWHVVVLALFVLLCGALFYHFYTERISNEALQAVDFQALRAHTAELLETAFGRMTSCFRRIITMCARTAPATFG